MIVKKLLVFLYRYTEVFIFKNFWLTRYRSIRYAKRKFYNVISRYKSDFTEIEGRKMFLDKNDSLKLSLYPYAQEQTNFFKKNIKEGDVVLDLGANIGYFTCLFAQLVGKTGKVFAFEPDQNNFQLIKKNVEVNGYKNVTIEQKAVTNKTSKLQMYLSNSPKDHRIYDPHDNRNSTEVDGITLDDYFKNSSQEINFIKSNIQGADFGAFQGMLSLIEKSKSHIVMALEFSPALLKGFGSDPEEFVDLLTKFGFKLHDIRLYEKILPISKEELLQEYTVENKKGGFLLCIPPNSNVNF
jgi:FkbM family methyltransferase